MTRRAKVRIALGTLIALMGVTVAGASEANADYFCRPYAKALNDGIHVGTCADIVVIPIKD